MILIAFLINNYPLFLIHNHRTNNWREIPFFIFVSVESKNILVKITLEMIIIYMPTFVLQPFFEQIEMSIKHIMSVYIMKIREFLMWYSYSSHFFHCNICIFINITIYEITNILRFAIIYTELAAMLLTMLEAEDKGGKMGTTEVVLAAEEIHEKYLKIQARNSQGM